MYNAGDYCTVGQAYGEAAAQTFNMRGSFREHPEMERSVEQLCREHPVLSNISKIDCVHCHKSETVILTHNACSICFISLNVLCTACWVARAKTGGYDCTSKVYACLKCVNSTRDKTCSNCHEIQWWPGAGMIECYCKNKICLECTKRCDVCYQRNFCFECLGAHKSQRCALCNAAKTNCKRCVKCKDQICDNCEVHTHRLICNCFNLRGSCIKCYANHFVPCKELNCLERNCPSMTTSRTCELCSKVVFHVKSNFDRINVCTICIQKKEPETKAAICCTCTNEQEAIQEAVRARFDLAFIDSEQGLVDILMEYCYPFYQKNVTSCSECQFTCCKKHDTLLDRRCSRCRGKEQEKKIKDRQIRKVAKDVIDYDISSIFG
jgi:hypothetical protein